jgi:putative intracellular protease/amidase
MSRTVHVAIYNTWADWEAGFALAHLGSGDWSSSRTSYEIRLVGESAEPIATKAGIMLTPDMVLADLQPEDSEMLVLPGADTWLAGENMAFVEAAQAFLGAGVPVAAICGATVGLARGGLLNDVDHTSNAVQALECSTYTGAARHKHDLAVTDGNLITASGIAPVEFAREIFTLLGFYDRATAENWYLLYGKHNPAGFLGLMQGAIDG